MFSDKKNKFPLNTTLNIADDPIVLNKIK